MLYPLMLLGLAGLAAPIVIHLIQRQRLKPQMLATLQFLDREDVANAFAPVPRDLLQLLLRLLLLLLIVLLMTRLIVGGDEVGPRSMAVILDRSMSMQQKVGVESLFDRHKTQILDLIDGMGGDDKLSLMLVDDRIAVETPYMQDREQLRAIVEDFEPGGGGGLAIPPAIRKAIGELRSRREVNACVLVFSDHQRTHYASALERIDQQDDRGVMADVREQLAAGYVQVLLVDEQGEVGANVALEQATYHPLRVYVGASARATTVVRNYADEAQTTNVTIYEGDTAGRTRSVDLEPGEAAHVDVVHRFESPVDSATQLEITDDVLPADNRFYLPMRMRDRRQVLLVAPPRGDQAQEDVGLALSYQGADLLAYALNPGEVLGQGSGTYINVKRITPALMERVSLPLYSTVILHGVAGVPEQSRDDLVGFVNNGGGLWIVPDPDLPPLRLNETFGPLLKGTMIGQLREPDQAQPLETAEGRIGHPMLLPLLREQWGDVRDIHFTRYFGLEATGGADPALIAGNGDWLAAVIRHGEGQVFLQLFSADLQSTSLPRSMAFVPFVQEVIATLGDRQLDQSIDMMRVGEVLRMRLRAFRGLSGEVNVQGPEDRQFALTGPDNDEIRVEGLVQPGVYAVTHPLKQTGRKRWLAVNPVTEESQLGRLSDADAAAVFGETAVARIPYADVHRQFTQRREIVWLMLWLVLIAFIVEAAIGAWQSRRARRREHEGGAA